MDLGCPSRRACLCLVCTQAGRDAPQNRQSVARFKDPTYVVQCTYHIACHARGTRTRGCLAGTAIVPTLPPRSLLRWKACLAYVQFLQPAENESWKSWAIGRQASLGSRSWLMIKSHHSNKSDALRNQLEAWQILPANRPEGCRRQCCESRLDARLAPNPVGRRDEVNIEVASRRPIEHRHSSKGERVEGRPGGLTFMLLLPAAVLLLGAASHLDGVV